MIKKISIKNYKSIVDDEIELGRVNVFIGANGAGKSNILEAVAMFSATTGFNLSTENLLNKGIRVTKPNLMYSSFLGYDQLSDIQIGVLTNLNDNMVWSVFTNNNNDIYGEWTNRSFDSAIILDPKTEEVFNKIQKKILEYPHFEKDEMTEFLDTFKKDKYSKADFIIQLYKAVAQKDPDYLHEKFENAHPILNFLSDFQIYTLSTPALRGITQTSFKQPLGLNGEGLDILLSTFNDEEWQLLRDYSHFISWLDDVFVDERDRLKFEGHKLGRSTSTLYFVDQFMRKNNNIFAAENANEGALYVLFYLALFISKKTPSFFAIDNIETALNPKICRALIESITELAEKTGKQVLITTHNPAVLDGIDLNNDNERLFVVSRNNEGHTKTKRIQFKPQNGQSKYKLSELWMRGKLGGIPQNFL